MSDFGLLDEKEEMELHKSRLLNVEEKPFKRITKRVGTLKVLVNDHINQAAAAAPPPENDAGAAPATAFSKNTQELTQMREDISLDFAAFDSAVVRLQLLQNAQAAERQRYAEQRVKILAEARRVRDRTAALREQLADAQATLARRRRFDELAERITANRSLRPRADQRAALAKLEDECAGLERERDSYALTWRERRDQFSRIVEEGMSLRRLIRDEKEEVERREGMDDGDAERDAADDAGSRGGATPRHGTSGNGTPSHDDGLKPRPGGAGSFSQNGSRGPSRDVSPNRSQVPDPESPEEGEDVEMDEPANADTPMGHSAADDNPRIVVDGREVDERDSMDTT